MTLTKENECRKEGREKEEMDGERERGGKERERREESKPKGCERSV